METPAPKIDRNDIVNVNGAGDAFFSGFVSYYVKTGNIESAVDFAKKMSYYTLKSSESVNLEIKNILG